MELDEHVFADDAFDSYAWLEEAVIDRGGNIPELVHLVPQLTLLSQSLTKSIHGTLHQLTIAGPQLQAQLDAMQRVTAPLSQQLDAVAATVGHPEASVRSPRLGDSSISRKREDEQDLQHLMVLHDAKERLQACSKALVEAARWEKNVRLCAASIEAVVRGDDVEFLPQSSDKSTPTLSERVEEMRKSLDILKEMPGAEDRKRTMDRLSSQIEAVLKPKLDEYLQAAQLPIAHVQFCSAVFASIGRSDHVVQAYCRCRPAQIHRVWYSYSPSESGSFAEWLETFYRELLRMIHRETDHAAQIFGDKSTRVLVSLLEHTLAGLKDSFRDRIKKDASVERLLEAYQTSSNFVAQVAKALRAGEVMVLDDETDSVATEGDRETADRVLAAILGPYQSFFVHYAQFASEPLARRLVSLVPRVAASSQSADDESGEASAVETYTQRLEDMSSGLWAAVEDSVRLCYEFTGGAAFPDAMEVVNAAVGQVVDRLVESLPIIRKQLGIGQAAAAQHGGHGMPVAEWGSFHAALALLRACGTLQHDAAVLEKRIGVRMREQAQRLFGSGGSSPRVKRSEFKRRPSASLSVSLATLAGDPARVTAAVMAKWLKEDAGLEKRVSSFMEELLLVQDADAGEGGTKVLVQVDASLERYARQVQTLVYDSVFAPIAQILRQIPTKTAWAKTPDADLGDLPLFSTLPQESITTVADLLLSLLPQLEPFAESSSLAKAALASQDAYRVCAREWAAFGQVLRLSGEEIDLCSRSFAGHEGEGGGGSSEATAFVDLWTSAVASGATAAFLTAVAKIPSLSTLGTKQLEADVAYLQNVLNALTGGASGGNFLFAALQTALRVSDSEYAGFVDSLRSDATPVEDTEQPERRIVLRLHETLLRQRLHPPTSSSSPATETSNVQLF